MTENEVLRVEKNGVEYFTVIKTGECGISQRGLARMCGVGQGSIRNILNLLELRKPPKTLENLVGQELYLNYKIVNRGKKVKAIKAEVAIGIVQYYAFRGRKTAQATLNACGIIGLTHYIHGRTNWWTERHTGTHTRTRTVAECS